MEGYARRAFIVPKQCPRCKYEYKRLKSHVGTDECISNERKTAMHERGFVQIDNATHSRLYYHEVPCEAPVVLVKGKWARAAFCHQSYVWLLRSMGDSSNDVGEVFASVRRISDEQERYRTAAVMARLNWANQS